MLELCKIMSDILITEKEQQVALDIAWNSIKAAISGSDYFVDADKLPNVFRQKAGAFVTAYKLENGKEELRGCIGVPQPSMILAEAIAKAARDTVISDPRFPRVKPEELNFLVIEVEILTPFEEINYKSLSELYENIHVGVDGLVLYSKFGTGLLLPPVPVKYNWDAKEFVQALCRKAWVDEDILLDKDTKLMKFQAKVIR